LRKTPRTQVSSLGNTTDIRTDYRLLPLHNPLQQFSVTEPHVGSSASIVLGRTGIWSEGGLTTGRAIPQYTGGTLQCHFVHLKSHTDWFGNGKGPAVDHLSYRWSIYLNHIQSFWRMQHVRPKRQNKLTLHCVRLQKGITVWVTNRHVNLKTYVDTCSVSLSFSRPSLSQPPYILCKMAHK